MLEFLLNTFVVLLVVVDPMGVAALFAGMTADSSEEERRRIALRGTAIATAILLPFLFGGQALLAALGISLEAFRIAGGFLLLLIAIDMLFGRQLGQQASTGADVKRRNDISVFPLAIPLIAGPGTMTTLLLRNGYAAGRWEYVVALVAVLLAVLAITYAVLRTTNTVMRWFGETGTKVMSRVLGMLLAALAVQYMIDGIQRSFFSVNA